ncbi:MAG: transporter substrate-binding domain-containing protein [Kiritimatiellae bacterium]|nr:transporter substrate-binding domain-containing protein [Kiritimatiellia bacterium]
MRVGVYQNEPKIFVDDQGQPSGFFVELLNEIARREGWSIQYVPCEWADCLQALRAGDLDLMPDVALTESRAVEMSFGGVPVLYGWMQVYRNPRVTLRSPLDLGNRRIAVLENSVQQHALTNLLFGFGLSADLVLCPSFDAAFRAVEQGGADAVLANRFFGERHHARYGLRSTDVMFYPSPLFYAARRGANADLLEVIDRHVDAWKKDPHSVYFELLRHWIEAEPVFRIPAHVRWALLLAVVLLGSALVMAAVLKWQVHLRTRELRVQNDKLRQALAELSRFQEHAMQQERLHVLGQMASGIAHDFNNILSLILNYAELIERSTKKSVDLASYKKELGIIMQAAQDGAAIVRRMREFYASAGAEHRMVPLAVNELLNSALTLSKPKWDTQACARGVKIATQTKFGDVPQVLGDEAELRQAFLNILINAIDAMPDGGELTLRTTARDSLVLVDIEDTGTGMPPDVLANCSRPFFTTKGQGGTGLGLSIVAATVARHGGRLDVQSAVGRGTCVRIEFPALARPEPVESSGGHPLKIRPLKILVAEDDPQLLAGIATWLSQEGHTVDTATRPLKALDKAASSTYDVFLFDLAMPEMSGLQLVELLRSRGCQTPVILITGTLESLGTEAASLSGVIHFLVKPFSAQRFNEIMASLGFQAA